MTHDLDSVKTRVMPARGYHHGALRPALIAAAEAVIAERGVDGFSLRETARRAGVSPSAPAHHFRDARGLLTAIAAAGFRSLGDALEEANRSAPDQQAGRAAQAIAYVAFALHHSARFDVMWRAAMLDRDDPDYAAAAGRAFSMLDQAARGDGSGKPGDPETAPSIAAWALVHGFARLALDGAFGTEKEAPARAAETLLPLVLRHLSL